MFQAPGWSANALYSSDRLASHMECVCRPVLKRAVSAAFLRWLRAAYPDVAAACIDARDKARRALPSPGCMLTGFLIGGCPCMDMSYFRQMFRFC